MKRHADGMERRALLVLWCSTGVVEYERLCLSCGVSMWELGSYGEDGNGRCGRRDVCGKLWSVGSSVVRETAY